MITVRFLGGAKKSFSTDRMDVDRSEISINELFELLASLKPENTPSLDTENVLIAINGVDSSAMEGKKTVIRDNDVVSIIPVIHGGSLKKSVFSMSGTTILVMEIKGQKNIDVAFLDNLRNDFKKLSIQAISSDFILNLSHLKKIINISLISKKNDTLLSNKIETDILMRFAITSQISDAISKTGIKPGKNFILIGFGNKKQLSLLESKLVEYSTLIFSKDNSKFLKKQFGINNKQLDVILSKTPLEDLLVEKAAVLFG